MIMHLSEIGLGRGSPKLCTQIERFLDIRVLLGVLLSS